MLSLSAIAEDPLAAEIDWSSDAGGGAVVSAGDDLGPIYSELRLPKAIETGLRTQGIDPATMSAAQLVTGTLSLIGYGVIEGPIDGTWYAEKGGSRTFIREVPHGSGDHPELEDEAISRFLFEFQSAGADRGLLVTDKFGPFSVYEKERREPRVRFLTRERLQKVAVTFIDMVGFTRQAETMAPAAMVDFVRQFHRRMEGIATFDIFAAVASDDPQTALSPPQATTDAMANPPGAQKTT